MKIILPQKAHSMAAPSSPETTHFSAYQPPTPLASLLFESVDFCKELLVQKEQKIVKYRDGCSLIESMRHKYITNHRLVANGRYGLRVPKSVYIDWIVENGRSFDHTQEEGSFPIVHARTRYIREGASRRIDQDEPISACRDNRNQPDEQVENLGGQGLLGTNLRTEVECTSYDANGFHVPTDRTASRPKLHRCTTRLEVYSLLNTNPVIHPFIPDEIDLQASSKLASWPEYFSALTPWQYQDLHRIQTIAADLNINLNLTKLLKPLELWQAEIVQRHPLTKGGNPQMHNEILLESISAQITKLENVILKHAWRQFRKNQILSEESAAQEEHWDAPSRSKSITAWQKCVGTDRSLRESYPGFRQEELGFDQMRMAERGYTLGTLPIVDCSVCEIQDSVVRSRKTRGRRYARCGQTQTKKMGHTNETPRCDTW